MAKKHEKMWDCTTKEMMLLQIAANTIRAFTGWEVAVKDVLLDAGQNWWHTSIIIGKPDGLKLKYQIGFVELDDIMSGNKDDFDCAVNYIIADLSCIDNPYHEWRKEWKRK